MPIERLRMRPWLENIINTNKYPGVEWLDREQKIFRIPWKHASRNGWKINTDASLFRAWAEHTGKYKAKEKPNPKTWKANFRCALNSLPDMMEVREKRSTKGSNAFKVYQMTDKPTCAEMKRPPRKYRGRYQRKKHSLSKSNDDQKESRPKSNPVNENETAGSEILEPVEVNTAMPFSVPQPLYRKHLVDHDYAVTRYFDLLDETAGEDMEEVFEVPETKIVKTEHFSSCLGRDLGDYSFYEDDNTNSKNLDRISSEEAADKVMSDDEVIELIDELSSECDSASADSGDTTMDDLLENCIDSMADDVETPAKQRANSAPAVLESSLDKFAVLTTSIITKSNSLPDIQTIMSTSPQDLLQSCLS